MKQTYKLSRYNVFHEIDDIQYIWNTYSGALLELDNEAQEYVKQFSGSDDGSIEFDTLKTNGFIVHEKIDEFGRVCFQERRALFSRYSDEMRFVFTLGMGCNYSCYYCFENKNKTTMQMTPEVAERTADYVVQQLKGNPMVTTIKFSWFGGEPLLYMPIIEIISCKLQAYIQQSKTQYNIESMLFTNGRFLDEATLIKLKEFGINKLQITLEGMQEVYCKHKGAQPEEFDCVIKNICNAAEKIELSIRLNAPNSKEAIAISEYLLGHHNLSRKTRFNYAFVRDYTMSPDAAKQSFIEYIDNQIQWMDYMYKHYKDVPRGADIPQRMNSSCGQIVSNNVVIGPQGEFYRCNISLGDDSMVTGDIWNGRYYNDKELMHYSTVDMYSDCSQCAYLPVCMGGCVMHRIDKYGGFDCDVYKPWRFRQKLMEGGVLS